MPSTTYSYDAGTESYFVTGGCGDATITIPDTYDDGSNGPHPVTRIDTNAFLNCTNLVTLIIGNNVTTIEAFAFQGCSSLTSVTFPTSSLTQIRAYAFQYCTSLTSITFPTSSLTTIANGVFWGSGLTSVVIPNSVTSMSDSIFVDCINLASVTLPINETINTLPQGTFVRCTSLTSITIPSNYRTIDIDCFTLSGLQTVVLNEGLTRIRVQAFYGCRSLRGTLTIPNTVTRIDARAFEKTGVVPSISNEFNITIGSGITQLNSHCFYECYAKSFTFITGNSSMLIGPGVFFGCIYLTNLSLPNSVTSIYPFSVNPGGFTYTDAPFDGTTLNTLTIGDGLVVGSGIGKISHYTFSQIFVGANISNLVLGKGITEVINTSFDESGFAFRGNLKSITFQGKMSTVGYRTFTNYSYPMDSLTEVFFNNFDSTFTFGAEAFNTVNYNVIIYIKPKQNLRIFKK
jgi:hypothetical protein